MAMALRGHEYGRPTRATRATEAIGPQASYNQPRSSRIIATQLRGDGAPGTVISELIHVANQIGIEVIAGDLDDRGRYDALSESRLLPEDHAPLSSAARTVGDAQRRV